MPPLIARLNGTLHLVTTRQIKYIAGPMTRTY